MSTKMCWSIVDLVKLQNFMSALNCTCNGWIQTTTGSGHELQI